MTNYNPQIVLINPNPPDDQRSTHLMTKPTSSYQMMFPQTLEDLGIKESESSSLLK